MKDGLIVDWLTGTLLAPMLTRAGIDPGTFARSLLEALEGTYEATRHRGLGRDVGWASFTTTRGGSRGRFVELAMPGDNDPFAPAVRATSLGRVPRMWGGVTRDGRAHALDLTALDLGNGVHALPRTGGGMLAFPGSPPLVAQASATGRPLVETMSHPETDPHRLIVRRMRPATEEEIGIVARDAREKAAVARQGITVASFRNPKTPRVIALADERR